MSQIEVKTEDELQSKTIDWLRFPLVIAVVFIHSFQGPGNVDLQQINYLNLSGIDVYNIISVLGSHVIAHIAVPCFFMFSGFLFFYKIQEWNKNIYLKKVKSRIKTLIIPYLLWNLIPVFVYAALKIIKFDGSVWLYFNELLKNGVLKIFWNYNEWESTSTNILGWLTPSFGPLNFPLWFLRDLIVMVFLSPLIFYFVKYTRHYGIVLLGILYYFKIWFITPGFSIEAVFFFSLGVYFSIHDKNIVKSLRKGKIFWLLLAVIAMILSAYYDASKMKDYFLPVYVLSGVITAINITSFLLEHKRIKVAGTLAKASFFVYATHMILILDWTGRLFDFVFKPQEASILIIRYFSVPLLSVFICLCLYFLMKRIAPGILSMLTGNR